MKNKKVYLRALESDDYKISIEWRQDPEIWSMLVGRRYFVSEQIEKQWVESTYNNSNQVTLAICDSITNTYIGNISLKNIDFFNKSASFAILVGNKDYWSGGYGTQATRLLLDHAFIDLGLERVQSIILSDNIGSVKMHEKCGFMQEGVLRNAVFKNGKMQDLILMSVLSQDFLKSLNNLA